MPATAPVYCFFCETFLLHAGQVSDDAVLKGMHAAAGLTIDADKFVERCKTDESIKAKLRENTEEVITRGGFGSPW